VGVAALPGGVEALARQRDASLGEDGFRVAGHGPSQAGAECHAAGLPVQFGGLLVVARQCREVRPELGGDRDGRAAQARVVLVDPVEPGEAVGGVADG
jgi:hypothetical protein